MSIWAISDIHGCYRTFEALLQKIGLRKEDELYLLGDYIDRGPGSKEVLDLILKLKKEDFNVHCLLGNHEIMLFHALEHPASLDAKHWKDLHGGKETLHSFGAIVPREIDPKYIDFLASMQYYIEKEAFILVHAGLNMHLADPFSDRRTMLWSFDDHPTVHRQWLGRRIIVHGHRIHSRQRIQINMQELHKFPILGIDNGCVYPYEDYHHLCAVELTTMELFFQENIDP